VLLWLLATAVVLPAAAQTLLPPDVSRTLGTRIPFDGFVNEEGRDVASLLREADGSAVRPWVVSPMYTRCLHTCSPITASLRSALEHSGLRASEYRVLSFSFDPNETAEGLRAFRSRLQLPEGWLTLRAADPAALARTLAALDFRTITLGDGAFDHPNLIVILAPDQRLAQYVFGVTFSAEQLATAVRRARAGVSLLAGWEVYEFAAAAIGFLVSAFVFLSVWSRRRGRGTTGQNEVARGHASSYTALREDKGNT
jgi:cytochrome oxidase Cu insertion factor (SCO1/SenC/PrrC family)